MISTQRSTGAGDGRGGGARGDPAGDGSSKPQTSWFALARGAPHAPQVSPVWPAAKHSRHIQGTSFFPWEAASRPQTCVEIRFWAHRAIDATLSPRSRRHDGVEVHEGPRNIPHRPRRHFPRRPRGAASFAGRPPTPWRRSAHLTSRDRRDHQSLVKQRSPPRLGVTPTATMMLEEPLSVQSGAAVDRRGRSLTRAASRRRVAPCTGPGPSNFSL